jgi:hypothetical protein
MDSDLSRRRYEKVFEQIQKKGLTEVVEGNGAFSIGVLF